MTFADLLTTLEARGALTPSRVKDLRTSLTYLAKALGHPGIEGAPVDETCKEHERWMAALEARFATLETEGQGVSPITRRNTRSNIRAVFRAAEAQGLLAAPLPSRLLKRTTIKEFVGAQRATAPYPETYGRQARQRYQLPQEAWPPDIVQGWQGYKTRRGLGVRETTFAMYARCLQTYFGYVAHIVGRPPVWEDLFDVGQVAEYVRWHAVRQQRTLTPHGRHVVRTITTIAHVIEHPAHPDLAALSSTMKPPTPTHVKRNHRVSLALLDEVGDACLAEGRLPLVDPRGLAHPGKLRALRFQWGVIIKLLVRVPLRQRNIREMRRDINLSQDPTTKHWHLDYSGDDLKVGYRGSDINTYHVDLTEDTEGFVSVLEEFLTVHRPKLPNADTSPFVFLTQRGKPYCQTTFSQLFSMQVALRTGKRFYPHLIRTVWATEALEKTRDVQMTATMLGDTPHTTMKTYYDVNVKDQRAKGKAFLASALHAG
jgi:hypothetical protein